MKFYLKSICKIQIVFLFFFYVFQLHSQDYKSIQLPKNSIIYLSADSIESFYHNLSLFDHDDKSYFDKSGNLVDHKGNVYFVYGGKSAKEIILPIKPKSHKIDLKMMKINQESYFLKASNIIRDFPVVFGAYGTGDDGDGVAADDDLDDDNDGILDSEEGLNCYFLKAIGPDGSFTPCSDDAHGDDEGRNGDVTCGDWINGKSTLDTWHTPRARLNCGNSKGAANGLPASPDGGVVAAGWAESSSDYESFYANVEKLKPGNKYDVVFWQTFAGITDGTNGCAPTSDNSQIGSKARWQVKFGVHPGYPGLQKQYSPERAFEGPGNQTWTKVTLRFTAEATDQRLTFGVDQGSDWSNDCWLCDYMAIDGIEMFEVAAALDCDTRDSDNDGVADHLDEDSDGDGCNDVVEAGFSDPDDDGVLGNSPVTVDGDGKVTGSGGYITPLDRDGIGGHDYIQEGAAVTVTSNPSVLESKQPGETVQFTAVTNMIDARECYNCKSAGVPAPVYQWQENTGGGWANLADGGKYSGVTTNELTITDLTVGMSGYKYQLVITTPSYVCGASVTPPESQLNVNVIVGCPLAVDDAYTVDEGATLTKTALDGVIFNDTDADNDPLTTSLVTTTTNGTLTLNGDGSFTYVHDGTETTTDSFTYQVNDGACDSNVATVTITVTPINDCPVGVDDAYTVDEGGTLTKTTLDGVIFNDTDAENDALTATLITTTTNGVLTFNSDGSFTYVHDGTETITDSFTYRVNDGACDSNISTVQITVNPINDCPEIISNPTSISLGECTSNVTSYDISLFFRDAEGTDLIYAASSSNTSLVKATSDNSSLTLSDIGEVGSSTITLVASDGDCETTLQFQVDIVELDTDGDGVRNCKEKSVGTNPIDGCSYNVEDITLPITSLEDCDGDGVLDVDEFNDGTDPNDPCSYDRLHISLPITIDSTCPVVFYDGFSPDGDGVNDTWVIPFIEQYPRSELIIYNRWGTIVYQTINYKSDWNGTSNRGKRLSEGVYFYSINLNNGSKTKKGYVYLRRRD